MSDTPGWYVPITPAGTPIPYGAANRAGKVNAARTEHQAWANLMEDARHMPYITKDDFVRRGYTVEYWENWEP